MYEVDVNRTKVAKSFIWKILERVFAQGIGFLVQIVLARILFPEDFGSLAIIVAITGYALIFVSSGITTTVIQRKELDKADLSTLMTYSLITGVCFYLILFFLAPWIASYYSAPILKPTLRVFSISLILQGLNSVQTGILQRQMRFKQLFLRTLIAAPIAGFVGISMALGGLGVWALVAYNLTNILAVIIIMSFDRDCRIPIGFSLEKMKQLFPFTSKIMLTFATSGLFDLVRTSIIGKRFSRDELAYYDKGLTYSGYVTMLINQSIGSVLLPTFSRSQEDLNALKGMARRSVRLTSFVMIPILVAVAVMAKPLVLLLLTEKWLPCVSFLIIYCFLRIPGPILNIDKQVFYALGKSNINLYYEIGLFVCNFIALFVAVRISVFAIAISALIVEFLGCMVIFIISSRVYGYSLLDRLSDMWKPLISSFVMALVMMWGASLNSPIIVLVFLQIILGIIVYVLMGRLLKDDNLTYCLSMIKDVLSKNN